MSKSGYQRLWKKMEEDFVSFTTSYVFDLFLIGVDFHDF